MQKSEKDSLIKIKLKASFYRSAPLGSGRVMNEQNGCNPQSDRQTTTYTSKIHFEKDPGLLVQCSSSSSECSMRRYNDLASVMQMTDEQISDQSDLRVQPGIGPSDHNQMMHQRPMQQLMMYTVDLRNAVVNDTQIEPASAQINAMYRNNPINYHTQSCPIGQQEQTTQHDSTSIFDLNDDCLIAIGQNLNEYELYTLRDTHSHFANATEYCYRKIESERSMEFDFKYWSEDNGIDDLVKILDYFGHCMTRVCIDECFTRFVREKCVSQSFLSERLSNVRYLRLYYAGYDGVGFISALAHIEEFEVIDTDITRMPFHARWSDLNRLSIIMYTGADELSKLQFRKDKFDKSMVFLLEHKRIQKLGININDSHIFDSTKLLEMIATHMCDLTELDVRSFFFSNSFQNISKMEKLQKLKIRLDSIDSECEYLKRLKNLKSLTNTDRLMSMRHLPKIVECVPTVNHLEIVYNKPEHLDFTVFKKIIEKRKLSPLCDRELLCISSAYPEPDPHLDLFTPKHQRDWNEYVTFSHWQTYEYQRSYVYLREWLSERKD